MAEMQTNSKERPVSKMVRKCHEQEGNEVIGTILGITDDVDSGDTTCSAGENRYPGWPGTSVFRMLIPATKVGPIIGHKGERVRRLCEETKASVHVIGENLAGAERAVIIFAKEQLDESIPPAMDALLRVYQNIINDDGLKMRSDSMVVTRILTPSEQATSLIGEQGSLISSIEKASKTNICVLDGDLPPVALEEDRIVEIWGRPAGVHKALELVASHLRKYLVHRSVIPFFDPHVPMTRLHMDMPPCHYSDHPEGPLRAFSPGCHSIYAEDYQHEPPAPWTDTCYSRSMHPMGKHINSDVFEYRWEAPTSFERYRSVTPPHHGIGAYRRETPSPMGAYLLAPMELCSHHNLTAYGWRSNRPIGPSATTERIRSLISVYGQQAHPLRKTYQSAKTGKHPHFEISLCESEGHPSRVSPSAAIELPPTRGISAYGLQASPSVRMYPPATVENLLHCRVSACVPEASPHVVVPSLTSKSPPVTSQVTKKMHVPIFYAEAVIGPTGARIDYIRRASKSSILINDLEEGAMSVEITGSAATDVQIAEQLIKNFMAEAAAASPGHNFHVIPSHLPAPTSPGAGMLATSYADRESGLTEQRLQMIY